MDLKEEGTQIRSYRSIFGLLFAGSSAGNGGVRQTIERILRTLPQVDDISVAQAWAGHVKIIYRSSNESEIRGVANSLRDLGGKASVVELLVTSDKPDNCPSSNGITLSGLEDDVESTRTSGKDDFETVYGIADSFRSKGNIDEAIFHFKRALVINPGSAEAYTALALLYMQQNRLRESEIAITYALKLNPQLGEALIAQSSLRTLVGCLNQKGAKDSSNAQSSESPEQLFHLGNRFLNDRNFERAIDCFRRAIEHRPSFHQAYLNMGNAYFNQGREVEALHCYSTACDLKADFFEAHFNRGNTNRKLGRFDEAAVAYEKALELKPDNVQALLGYGGTLSQLGRSGEAVTAYRKATAIDPKSLRASVELGNTLRNLGLNEQSELQFRKVLELDPGFAEGYFQIANVQKDRGKTEEAIISFNQALAINPELVGVLNNLGNAYLAIERSDLAIEAFSKAMRIAPRHTAAINNLGNAYFSGGQVRRALELYDRAVELEPGNIEAHWNRSFALLQSGRYEEGWKEFEWRLKAPRHQAPQFPEPQWDGSDLTGKRIYVYLEQGFGDCIHCARYVPILVERGARVVLETRGPLRRLFETIPGVQLVERAKKPVCDFCVSIMSLPHLLGTTLESVPAAVPYLGAPSDPLVITSKSDRPKIGFVWKGNPHQGNDRNRSSSLESFLDLLAIPDLKFCCLQKDLTEREISLLKDCQHVEMLDRKLSDFADTAKAIMEMDLVITVDTSVAHLAGALGKPVWIVLCHNASWQWLEGRNDSPWYPTATLFRQSSKGDWRGVLKQVILALKERYQIRKLPGEYQKEEALELAVRYAEIGYFKAAEESLAAIDTNSREYPRALFIKSRLAQHSGDLARAKDLILMAIALGGDQEEYLVRLGDTYAAMQDIPLARSAYSRAASLPGAGSKGFIALGTLAFQADDLLSSRQFVSNALDRDSGCPEVHLLEALICEKEGSLEAGIKACQKALVLDPAYAEASLTLARLLEKTGLTSDAFNAVQRILESTPDCIDALIMSAHLLISLNSLKEASMAISRLETITESDPRVSFVKGMVQFSSGDLKSALDSMHGSLILNPSELSTHIELGRMLLQHGALYEALASFKQAVWLEPSSSDAYLGMARVYAALGKYDRSHEAVQRAFGSLRSHQAAGESHTPSNRGELCDG